MLFDILEIFAVAVACTCVATHYIHLLQLDRYSLSAYRVRMRQNRDRFLRENVLWSLVAAIARLFLPILLAMIINEEDTRTGLAGWLVLILFCALAGYITWRDLSRQGSRPLILSHRVRRLMALVFALCFVIAVLLRIIVLTPYPLFMGVPYIVQLAAMILAPVEERLNVGYMRAARQALKQHKRMAVVGIAGSFGKTNVKNILREMLAMRYRVLATPASYNTAMGICRTINEELEDDHQVFIVEMGTTQKGDIRKLVKLVHPRYGILTGIGPRRLRVFKSIENIAEENYELIRSLPEKGFAVFGSGDSYVDRLYAMCDRPKRRVSLSREADSALWAENVMIGLKGMSFTLVCAEGGSAYCTTRLLGRYNLRNILAAAAMALRLGVTLDEISTAVKKLRPAEHRLQLVPGQINVIDDTLNTDVNCALEAVRMLSQLPGNRIVVTPGLGRTGERFEEDNFALGEEIARLGGQVIIVGREEGSRSLVRGLQAGGMTRSRFRRVRDDEEAESVVAQFAQPGDSVLYECRIEEDGPRPQRDFT